MHAYIIVGGSEKSINKKINDLVSKHHLTTLSYTITKIDDVREMKSFTSLKVTKPTGIIIRGIKKATIEALNAFLKNLEEPQPSLYYILISPDIRGLVPTIISRCQIITLKDEFDSIKQQSIEKYALDLISLPIGEKFLLIDKVKKRDEALELIEKIILGIHPKLLKKGENIKHWAKVLSLAEKTRQALLQNGNIQLHLTNFIISI